MNDAPPHYMPQSRRRIATLEIKITPFIYSEHLNRGWRRVWPFGDSTSPGDQESQDRHDGDTPAVMAPSRAPSLVRCYVWANEPAAWTAHGHSRHVCVRVPSAGWICGG
ncbi:hypothetical protein CPLU01_14130 [Colletotrichum plurivorum]|uniref:Uncharacterized protein n=1 Tax=Colletotrichum plurivorum TaxID=2175906 RepID=A0A8H6JML2_9PEZI|nr:hypothetical protein CPLU01_14130 [Colletotrichum plurivorum]